MAKFSSHFYSIGQQLFMLYTLCVICSLFVGFNNSASLSMFNLCSFYSRSSFRILLFSSFKISRLVILGFLVNILTLFEYKKDAWKLSSFNTNYDTKSSTENGHQEARLVGADNFHPINPHVFYLQLSSAGYEVFEMGRR